MVSRILLSALFCLAATTTLQAAAPDFESQLAEISTYSKEVDSLFAENDVSNTKPVYIIEDTNEVIQSLLDGAYYWHGQGYTSYAKTRMYGVRAQASEMRDAAFDLYYDSPQDQFVAYYTWFYAQSMMTVANEVLATL